MKKVGSGGVGERFVPERLFNLEDLEIVVVGEIDQRLAGLEALSDDRGLDGLPLDDRSPESDLGIDGQNLRPLKGTGPGQGEDPDRQPGPTPLIGMPACMPPIIVGMNHSPPLAAMWVCMSTG